MNYESRIKALEDRVHELESGVSPKPQDRKSATKGKAPGPINLVSTQPDGSTLIYISLLPTGDCVIDNKVIRNPAEIGEAILKFQKARVEKVGAQLLSMPAKGEA